MNIDQVKARFRQEGKTFAGWARENGFKPNDVHSLMSGAKKGRYGKTHEIAVALGLKNPKRGDK